MKGRKRIGLVMLAVLAFMFAGSVMADGGEPNLYHQGLRLGLTNRFGEAAKTFGRIPNNDPAFYDARILINISREVKDGTISRESGLLMYSAMQRIIDEQYDLAGPDIDKAMKLAPKCAQAYDIHAILNRHRHRNEEAMDDFAEAVKLDPKDIVALGNRGYMFQTKRRYDDAIAEYDKALAADPNQPRTYYNRGWIFDHKDQYDQAFADYSRAIKADPQYENAYVMRAAIYMRREQLDKAMDDYSKAKAIDPKDGWVYEGLGVLYWQHKNEIDKGCGYLRQACKLGKCRLYGHMLDDRKCPVDPTVQATVNAWNRANAMEKRR